MSHGEYGNLRAAASSPPFPHFCPNEACIVSAIDGEPDVNQLLTTRELAKSFGIPLDWVKREAKGQRLPHVQIGKRLFFNHDAVRAYLAQLARGNGTPPLTEKGHAHVDR